MNVFTVIRQNKDLVISKVKVTLTPNQKHCLEFYGSTMAWTEGATRRGAVFNSRAKAQSWIQAHKDLGIKVNV